MKQYLLFRDGKDVPVGRYDTKGEAADVMNQIINRNNDCLDSYDENYLTAFDFRLEEVEVKDPYELSSYDFANACAALNIKLSSDHVTFRMGDETFETTKDALTLIHELNPYHVKALLALNKLFTIAEAWNKADGFVPDFSDASQYKYYPWFAYDKRSAGFVYAYTTNAATHTTATRLCFKNEARAREFGKKYGHLFNDVLLFDTNN